MSSKHAMAINIRLPRLSTAQFGAFVWIDENEPTQGQGTGSRDENACTLIHLRLNFCRGPLRALYDIV